MFESRGLVEHLARGVFGIGALALAVLLPSLHVVWSLLLVALGLVALRGCPMCWTLGLVQTLQAKLRGRASDAACVDGSCARFQRRCG